MATYKIEMRDERGAETLHMFDGDDWVFNTDSYAVAGENFFVEKKEAVMERNDALFVLLKNGVEIDWFKRDK